MYKLIFIILTYFVNASAFCQKNLAGEYQTNIPAYGMFGEKLQLNCDGTMLLNFRGDLMNDTSFGMWKKTGNLLILNFDTLNSVKRRYIGIQKFKIKAAGLFTICMTRVEYKKVSRRIAKYESDSLKKLDFPKYSFFKKNCGAVIKNSSSSETHKQYFIRKKTYECIIAN